MTFGQMKKTFRLIQINGNINPEFSLWPLWILARGAWS